MRVVKYYKGENLFVIDALDLFETEENYPYDFSKNTFGSFLSNGFEYLYYLFNKDIVIDAKSFTGTKDTKSFKTRSGIVIITNDDAIESVKGYLPEEGIFILGFNGSVVLDKNGVSDGDLILEIV